LLGEQGKRFPDNKKARLSFIKVFFIIFEFQFSLQIQFPMQFQFYLPFWQFNIDSLLRHDHKNIETNFLEFIEMYASLLAQFASLLA
jgi:hypothetical protein